MAEDINVVVLVGRLTKDAEIKYTPSGFAISKLSLAVNRRKKQGDQWIEEGNFFDCNLFGKRAEGLNPYLTKGQQVTIEGKLKQERWEQPDGQKRSKISIDISTIQLLGGKSGSNNNTTGNQSPPPSQKSPASYNNNNDEDRFEDDVPF